jgi:hypothetical protein
MRSSLSRTNVSMYAPPIGTDRVPSLELRSPSKPREARHTTPSVYSLPIHGSRRRAEHILIKALPQIAVRNGPVPHLHHSLGPLWSIPTGWNRIAPILLPSLRRVMTEEKFVSNLEQNNTEAIYIMQHRIGLVGRNSPLFRMAIE